MLLTICWCRASHHFSFFAFDGQKGSLRWKHAAGDFIDELITPQLDYKLDAASTRNRHHGEMPWQVRQPTVWCQRCGHVGVLEGRLESVRMVGMVRGVRVCVCGRLTKAPSSSSCPTVGPTVMQSQG